MKEFSIIFLKHLLICIGLLVCVSITVVPIIILFFTTHYIWGVIYMMFMGVLWTTIYDYVTSK